MTPNRGMRYGFIAILAAIATASWSLAVARESPSRALLRMHDGFVLAFIDSEGFGQRRLPAMASVLHQPVDGTPWFVADLALIGVAKHHPPVVFPGEMSIFHQPDKEVPATRAASRPMTAWERQSLRDLDAGQRLVVRKDGAGLRVVGAIRAGGECLGCHKGKRAGDMLGAFVYTLQPLPPETPAAK
jgi:hypothetical protein